MGFLKRKKRKKKFEEIDNLRENEYLKEPKIRENEYFEPHFLFKVILIGHNDSGKISSLERFGNSWFESNTKLTLGISFEVKEIRIENINIKLQIWDLAAKERWKILAPYYCRGALGAILIFDVSNAKSLYQLLEWVQIIRENTKSIPIILMGNLDESNNPREVSAESALDFLKSNGLSGYFEGNIAKGEKFANIFESLIHLIIKKYDRAN
ncbi:MAG: GTP-binding protein [Candidatus Lokiarchaeota archaeon]|jgi:Ras-related protein Rab-11A